MRDTFARLPLAGGLIRTLHAVLGESVAVDLLVPQRRRGIVNSTQALLLTFYQVQDFQIDVHSDPWLEVVRQSESRRSATLMRVRKRLAHRAEPKLAELRHFVLTFNRGTIEVVARSYTLGKLGDWDTAPTKPKKAFPKR